MYLYNPNSNSWFIHFGGISWKTIKLALCTNDLEIADWEMVIPKALYSLLSLLSTATNEVPHNCVLRFPCCFVFGTNNSI